MLFIREFVVSFCLIDFPSPFFGLNCCLLNKGDSGFGNKKVGILVLASILQFLSSKGYVAGDFGRAVQRVSLGFPSLLLMPKCDVQIKRNYIFLK